MNEINKRQSDENGRQLRYSFVCWYNRAKRVNTIIIFISFIIAIFSVINILFKFKLNDYIAFLGAFWIFICIVLKNMVNNYKKTGADIQEVFDTYIFDLEKNSLIGMPQMCEESIYSYSNKNQQNIEELYYAGLESANMIKNIIIAQRDSIVYDKNMRKAYYIGNIIALIIYLFISFALGIIYGLKIEEFLASIIIPAINIVVYFTDNIIMIKSELEILRECELSIKPLFDDVDNGKSGINESICRKYQDFIYMKRRNWVMIPNYIYKIKQKYKKTRINVNKQLSSN